MMNKVSEDLLKIIKNNIDVWIKNEAKIDENGSSSDTCSKIQ